MLPRVSVIVPVYNHWDKIGSLIESLESQDFPSELYEVILVDNGSEEILFNQSLHPKVSVYVESAAGSYSARNKGVSMAKGELFVFTDADCIPVQNWLSVIWGAYQGSDRQTLIAGGVTVTKLDAGEPNKVEIYDSFLGIPQRRYATRRGYAVTANLAIPRVVFEKVGFFDAKRFSGGDAEFCQRAVKNGAKLVYVDHAKVLHPARSSWDDLVTKAKRVKGGQIRNGSFLRRFSFFLKSFLMPLIALHRVIFSDMSNAHKKTVAIIVVKLGVIELIEVFLLLFGKTPERR